MKHLTQWEKDELSYMEYGKSFSDLTKEQKREILDFSKDKF